MVLPIVASLSLSPTQAEATRLACKWHWWQGLQRPTPSFENFENFEKKERKKERKPVPSECILGEGVVRCNGKNHHRWLMGIRDQTGHPIQPPRSLSITLLADFRCELYVTEWSRCRHKCLRPSSLAPSQSWERMGCSRLYVTHSTLGAGGPKRKGGGRRLENHRTSMRFRACAGRGTVVVVGGGRRMRHGVASGICVLSLPCVGLLAGSWNIFY